MSAHEAAEKLLTQFNAVVDSASAEELVTMLAQVASLTGAGADAIRRPVTRMLAVRLAIKVMEPGYLEVA